MSENSSFESINEEYCHNEESREFFFCEKLVNSVEPEKFAEFKHYLDMNKKLGYRCQLCKKYFSKYGLGGHMSKKHPNQSEKYKKRILNKKKKIQKKIKNQKIRL